MNSFEEIILLQKHLLLSRIFEGNSDKGLQAFQMAVQELAQSENKNQVFES